MVESPAFGEVGHSLAGANEQDNRNERYPTLRFEFTMATRASHTARKEHLAEG
jgi:hypothetical protein